MKSLSPFIIQDLQNIILDYITPRKQRYNLNEIIRTKNMLLFQILSKEEKKKLYHGTLNECGILIMDYAAEQGYLEVVKWLHKNGCQATFRAMDYAAAKGYLEIVKWLHENRKEGCTVWAMNWSAENGHLEIIKWLHENRTEGCSSSAVEYAAENGHLFIVKWLFENHKECYYRFVC